MWLGRNQVIEAVSVPWVYGLAQSRITQKRYGWMSSISCHNLLFNVIPVHEDMRVKAKGSLAPSGDLISTRVSGVLFSPLISRMMEKASLDSSEQMIALTASSWEERIFVAKKDALSSKNCLRIVELCFFQVFQAALIFRSWEWRRSESALEWSTSVMFVCFFGVPTGAVSWMFYTIFASNMCKYNLSHIALVTMVGIVITFCSIVSPHQGHRKC